MIGSKVFLGIFKRPLKLSPLVHFLPVYPFSGTAAGTTHGCLRPPPARRSQGHRQNGDPVMPTPRDHAFI